jgi:hypothetical protein
MKTHFLSQHPLIRTLRNYLNTKQLSLTHFSNATTTLSDSYLQRVNYLCLENRSVQQFSTPQLFIKQFLSRDAKTLHQTAQKYIHILPIFSLKCFCTLLNDCHAAILTQYPRLY